jgi:seryl-tRNA synthetase
MTIPTFPPQVPVGKDERKKTFSETAGEKPASILNRCRIGAGRKIGHLDFERGVKITVPFYILAVGRPIAARVIAFMLDLHIRLLLSLKYTPFMVKSATRSLRPASQICRQSLQKITKKNCTWSHRRRFR